MVLIERVLYLAPKIRVYGVPPVTSLSGYMAKDWGVEDERSVIFMGRLRIIESAEESDDDEDESGPKEVKVDVRIEDKDSGELFANCPYESQASVEQVSDSTRFFAIRVVHGRQKATLGIGFEDRSDAFDFGVCLQGVRRQWAIDKEIANKHKGGPAGAGNGGFQSILGGSNEGAKADYSLKEGEMISITIGNKGRRKPQPPNSPPKAPADNAAFPMPFLPPPPSAEDVKKRQSRQAEDFSKMGFDDEPFGDFV